MQTMLGFSGLLLSLGGLYWLISDGNRRLVSAASRASPDTVAARLEHAEAIIELQKKVAALLGVPAESDGGS